MSAQTAGLARQVQSNRVAQQSGPPDAETQVREAIKTRLPTIRALLPDVLDERKLAALVITEVHKNPTLATCDEATLIGCVLRAAALGLQFGQDLGEAYLIPRKNQGRQECTLQLGYRGVLRLAERSGRVQSITTRSVYACDFFEFEFGLDEKLVHRPGPAEHRTAGNLTHAYAIARYINGGRDFEVLTRQDIDARRARGKGAQPAWQSDYAKMAEKSAVLAMKSRLPLASEVARALADDGAAITVSSRGPAALEAHHDEPPALGAGEGGARTVDAGTGEVTPPAEDPTPPEQDQAQNPHTQLIGAAAGKTVHKDLARLNVPGDLHPAVVLRMSRGRTTHAAELQVREADAHGLESWAKACVGAPIEFVEATLAQLRDGPGGPEAEAVTAALTEWLAKQGGGG